MAAHDIAESAATLRWLRAVLKAATGITFYEDLPPGFVPPIGQLTLARDRYTKLSARDNAWSVENWRAKVIAPDPDSRSTFMHKIHARLEGSRDEPVVFTMDGAEVVCVMVSCTRVNQIRYREQLGTDQSTTRYHGGGEYSIRMMGPREASLPP